MNNPAKKNSVESKFIDAYGVIADATYASI
jgi:hypothetical protein